MTILNVFVAQISRYGNIELVTPPADGCILNGVTRQTLIDLKDEIKAQTGLDVAERNYSIHELINSDKEGRLLSVFGASTYCPLLPVSRICYRDTTVLLDTKKGQKINDKLDRLLVDAMQADSGPWITSLE